MATFNTPLEIARELRQTVIGQTLGIMKMSVAAYDHSVRIGNLEARPNASDRHTPAKIEIAKSNVLLLGPTGSGKTLLAQALARILQVPFAMADATTLTEAGYVGEDVENIVLKLLMAAGHDVEKAQRGIIYIDELDKIGMKGDNPSITRDVSGEGVQQGLLKLVEGTIASLPPAGGRKHPQTEFVQVDTTNILFIAGGAFSGLDKIIQKRLSANQASIGFGATLRNIEAEREAQKNICELATAEDLVKFGLIPELVGRFPVLTGLRELTVDQLVEILTRPRNAIVMQQIALARADANNPMVLTFEPDALLAIAEESYRLGTGARGLRSIIEETLLPVKFERPPSIRITRVQVEKRQEQLLDAAARLDEKMEEPATKKAA